MEEQNGLTWSDIENQKLTGEATDKKKDVNLTSLQNDDASVVTPATRSGGYLTP
jgi:hypothetical protein